VAATSLRAVPHFDGQFSHGAAGIGLAFAKAAILLNQPKYLSVAMQAGEATYQYGDFRSNPTFCTGLAGGGELLVELHKNTREDIWLERAQEFAQKALAYRSVINEQSFWPRMQLIAFQPISLRSFWNRILFLASGESTQIRNTTNVTINHQRGRISREMQPATTSVFEFGFATAGASTLTFCLKL